MNNLTTSQERNREKNLGQLTSVHDGKVQGSRELINTRVMLLQLLNKRLEPFVFFLKLKTWVLFASEGNMTTSEQNKENTVHAVRVKGDLGHLCRFGKRNTRLASQYFMFPNICQELC